VSKVGRILDRTQRSLTYVTPQILNYLLRFYIIPAMSYKRYSRHQQITIII